MSGFLLAKRGRETESLTLDLYQFLPSVFLSKYPACSFGMIHISRMLPVLHEHEASYCTDCLCRIDATHLDAVDDIKYKAMFAVMYSSGMSFSDPSSLWRSPVQIHANPCPRIPGIEMDRYTAFLSPNVIWISLHNTGLKGASPWHPVSE